MAEENEEEVDKVVFTDEQIAELKQAFALFDMDGSGEVSTDELGTVLETLGQKVTQEELVQIIAEVDQDGGGSVDFDEFVDLMSSRMSESNEEYDIIDVFKVRSTGYTQTLMLVILILVNLLSCLVITFHHTINTTRY